MIEVKFLDHCGIIVPNLENAIQWYEATLNFTLITVQDDIRDAPDWKIAMLRCGQSRLELLEQKSMREKLNWQPPDQLYSSFIGKKHMTFAVADLDATFEELVSKGVRVVRPIAHFPEPNIRFCHFSDPCGNVLEFLDVVPTKT
jgi:catechol 2,3-dioxygenase-like lactoylglutathione lyase family enzyme